MVVCVAKVRLPVAAGSLWLSLSVAVGQGLTAAASPITFDTAFEAGSAGRIEVVGTNCFRVHVAGQQDERGRNRQASWYCFRMDGVRYTAVTLTLTDFVGEYNDRPGAVPMTARTRPVFSTDGEHWQQFPAMDWDDVRNEATLRFQVDHERVWIAHVPPYPYSRVESLKPQTCGQQIKFSAASLPSGFKDSTERGAGGEGEKGAGRFMKLKARLV
jgi:hypothetical protein